MDGHISTKNKLFTKIHRNEQYFGNCFKIWNYSTHRKMFPNFIDQIALQLLSNATFSRNRQYTPTNVGMYTLRKIHYGVVDWGKIYKNPIESVVLVDATTKSYQLNSCGVAFEKIVCEILISSYYIHRMRVVVAYSRHSPKRVRGKEIVFPLLLFYFFFLFFSLSFVSFAFWAAIVCCCVVSFFIRNRIPTHTYMHSIRVSNVERMKNNTKRALKLVCDHANSARMRWSQGEHRTMEENIRRTREGENDPNKQINIEKWTKKHSNAYQYMAGRYS